MIPKSDVKKLVGNPFLPEENGYARGCLQPMYDILPETRKFRYPTSEDANIQQYFEKFCERVEYKDMQYGDLIIIQLPMNLWHLMVYIGSGKGIHCNRYGTSIEDVKVFKSRIRGVYRYGNCGNNVGMDFRSYDSH